MTFFGRCCAVRPDTDCSLDEAAAAILRRLPQFSEIPVFSGGSVSKCRHELGDQDPYAVLQTFLPGEAQFGGYDNWYVDGSTRIRVYTASTAAGMQAVMAAMDSLIRTERLEFAAGTACVDRPAVPQQYDSGNCMTLTQVQLSTVAHLLMNTGA